MEAPPSNSHRASNSGWPPSGVVALTACLIVAGIILWLAAEVVLLVFMGILLAILLNYLSALLRDHSPLSHGWSLGVVLLTLLILIAAFVGLASARVATETSNMTLQVQETWSQLKEQSSQSEWLQSLIPDSETDYLSKLPEGLLGRITGVFGATFGALSGILLVLFIGIFCAADPGLYRRGLIHLVPLYYRPRTQGILDEAEMSLRWWIIGQLLSMTVVGIATAVGLWMLGIPFAFALGILAGVLTFIPNFGPILSAVPAVLLAMADGPLNALYVVLLYIGVQAVESNLLTPLVQQRNVHLPPVVGVGAQVLMGVLVGLPGLIVAVPLAVLGMVLVKRIYVEDTLGDSLDRGNGQAEERASQADPPRPGA